MAITGTVPILYIKPKKRKIQRRLISKRGLRHHCRLSEFAFSIPPRSNGEISICFMVPYESPWSNGEISLCFMVPISLVKLRGTFWRNEVRETRQDFPGTEPHRSRSSEVKRSAQRFDLERWSRKCCCLQPNPWTLFKTFFAMNSYLWDMKKNILDFSWGYPAWFFYTKSWLKMAQSK